MNVGTLRISFVFAFVCFGIVHTESRGDESLKSNFKDARFSKSGHTVDKLELVKRRLKGKHAVLIDVREQVEWDAGHLKDANFVPMSAVKSQQLDSKMKKALPKGKPIYCHCRSGGRVLLVTKILREQGFDVRPLRQGFADLVDAGFERASEDESESE